MRKPEVIRTVNYCKSKVKVYNPDTDTIEIHETLTTVKTDKAIKNALPDNVKFISVLETEKISTKRKMLLETFLEHSEEIK